ncbi:neutral zinc metallopeptidase [Paracoccus fistulariae]|uniref:Neutral zinc metallopeptidase n=1 Tax=Paracoccus fistulariae TaxID=658446 RepID=A0ABY7SLH7_9RHOB|nr:neutral zinc metallopeptidase [Paracoccus fistulariae]MDB6182500.1 neutral zinc metallopeptidase [Paracoccus fistulariae]WCR07714.1 neutral zinc metallopeptidase [Paracoccus fistulariae]
MQWRGRRGSGNVEDRRSMGAAGAGGMGVVGMLAVLAFGYFFGVDISPIVRELDQAPGEGSGPLTQEDEKWGQFMSVVLADTEEVWATTLPEQAGIRYRDPTLVLFRGTVQSACGTASSAMGPFYCPGDQKLYLDTDFFDMMARRMGAGGDFAYAYVIAHEVGHHVQNLTGVLQQVNSLRARVSRSDSNKISVLTELQADCYAGIWARGAQERFGTLEPGDLEEAQRAAQAVGDDVIQSDAGRVPVPDSFTHGSADQRQEWLMRGFQSGDMGQCDTFAQAGL